MFSSIETEFGIRQQHPKRGNSKIKDQELKRPGNSKTVVAEPDTGGIPAATRRARFLRPATPEPPRNTRSDASHCLLSLSNVARGLGRFEPNARTHLSAVTMISTSMADPECPFVDPALWAWRCGHEGTSCYVISLILHHKMEL